MEAVRETPERTGTRDLPAEQGAAPLAGPPPAAAGEPAYWGDKVAASMFLAAFLFVGFILLLDLVAGLCRQ